MMRNYIEVIAEARNISVAADKLGISQPALSAYLRKTEEQLGTVLFDRSQKPLTLTEAGEIYLRYTEKAEALHKELMQEISDIENLRSGSLTIGGAAFFNTTYIPAAVARFISHYPKIEVEIVDGTVPDISISALNGKIDMFITPTADDNERFIYEKLLDEKIFMAVPAQWIINETLGQDIGKEYKLMGEKDFRKLSEETFVLLNKGQHIRHKMDRLFEHYSFSPKHTVTVDQTMTSLALTRAGVGISLITESTIRNSGLREYPQLYLPDEKICSREIFIAYPRNKYISRGTTEFIKILKQENNIIMGK